MRKPPGGARDPHIRIRAAARHAAVFYTDVNLRYRLPWSKDLSVYGSVNNLFNKAPPFPTNQILHDAVGRYFRIGVDAKF
jgi:outer membrane receptor protein involved in Fe transport